MSGLLNLTGNDFSLGKGQKGNLLFNNIRHYSVVLFYATTCDYCKPYIQIFKKLPGNVAGCTFAITNIQSNMTIVQMAKQTISPIEFVPLIIYYVDGRPFMKYNGEADGNQIVEFIVDVTEKLGTNTKSKFYEDRLKQQEQDKKIPEYTIGKPKETSARFVGDMICNDGVCYISEAKDIVKSNEGKHRAQQHKRS